MGQVLPVHPIELQVFFQLLGGRFPPPWRRRIIATAPSPGRGQLISQASQGRGSRARYLAECHCALARRRAWLRTSPDFGPPAPAWVEKNTESTTPSKRRNRQAHRISRATRGASRDRPCQS